MLRIDSTGQVLAERLSLPGRTVVDVGCGTGELVRWLVGQGATATGVDTPAMLARAEAAPRAGDEHYLPGGGEALPLPDGHADVLVYAASLHHVPAERLGNAMVECARVLRPGGEAAFLEPVAGPGYYSEITRLTGDEEEIQRLAYAAILDGGRVGLEGVSEELVYFSRSFADYEHLVAVFVDDPALRAECLAQAREITERHAAAAGVPFDAYRYCSVCRLSILRRIG
ncbi:MAG: class I SAM-dependent methyltransferase [Thermoanaerobaculaceae bacterium]|jgi:SAM-dependent methyltransferase|nr:class I SAM-dependent methyltransferase [Thermoanaerobaculaceae bacterium]